MENLINQLFSLAGKSWWLEILAASPSRGYYFGPFTSENEAIQEQLRYVQTIEQEGREVLLVSVVRREAPAERTVDYTQAA
ncbi:DUF1816 domain-containing protein [Leptothoe sp. PORK10 BA2]|uniref:DUF1816 domain-containing protein n=1 Tax=Leptothoe sp. PORK10 BA2 TaxID=3110254 RepID=UPI002B205B86|nr:DUF1816 domain-containing protein [Leptothoe sp. PORK10 BA2]MEA5464879.1 DUF1816 domain-containing protein [Leptothoe sp. PORK10 BA2]